MIDVDFWSRHPPETILADPSLLLQVCFEWERRCILINPPPQEKDYNPVDDPDWGEFENQDIDFRRIGLVLSEACRERRLDGDAIVSFYEGAWKPYFDRVRDNARYNSNILYSCADRARLVVEALELKLKREIHKHLSAHTATDTADPPAGSAERLAKVLTGEISREDVRREHFHKCISRMLAKWVIGYFEQDDQQDKHSSDDILDLSYDWLWCSQDEYSRLMSKQTLLLFLSRRQHDDDDAPHGYYMAAGDMLCRICESRGIDSAPIIKFKHFMQQAIERADFDEQEQMGAAMLDMRIALDRLRIKVQADKQHQGVSKDKQISSHESPSGEGDSSASTKADYLSPPEPVVCVSEVEGQATEGCLMYPLPEVLFQVSLKREAFEEVSTNPDWILYLCEAWIFNSAPSQIVGLDEMEQLRAIGLFERATDILSEACRRRGINYDILRDYSLEIYHANSNGKDLSGKSDVYWRKADAVLRQLKRIVEHEKHSVALLGETREEKDRSLDPRGFCFVGTAQALYRDKDLGLPSGYCIEVLKKLVDSFGKAVEYRDLDCTNGKAASQTLKNAKNRINRSLKVLQVPCEVRTLKGEGYVLQRTSAL